MNACGGGNAIGAAAVDKEADVVDEPLGGSSTSTDCWPTLMTQVHLSKRQLPVGIFEIFKLI